MSINFYCPADEAREEVKDCQYCNGFGCRECNGTGQSRFTVFRNEINVSNFSAMVYLGIMGLKRENKGRIVGEEIVEAMKNIDEFLATDHEFLVSDDTPDDIYSSHAHVMETLERLRELLRLSLYNEAPVIWM